MACENKIKVSLFVRKPFKVGNFSVEIYTQIIYENIDNIFDIKIKQLPFRSKGILPRIINCLYALFNQSEINHILGDIHYIAIFLNRKNTILTILDSISLKAYKGIKRKIIRLFWFQIPIRKSSLILTISEFTKNELLNEFNSPFNCKVLHLSVSKDFKKSNLSFNEHNPKILQLGTAPNKNIENLAKGLVGIKCELIIVGKLSSSQLQALKKNKINFKEYDYALTNQEIVNLYNGCDIISLISTYEGFGMPIVEGNLVGRPVISSKLSSMPEIASDAAILVDPYDVDEINKGVKSIIEDKNLREKLILNGYSNAKKYSINHQMEKLKDIYLNFLNT